MFNHSKRMSRDKEHFLMHQIIPILKEEINSFFGGSLRVSYFIYSWGYNKTLADDGNFYANEARLWL